MKLNGNRKQKKQKKHFLKYIEMNGFKRDIKTCLINYKTLFIWRLIDLLYFFKKQNYFAVTDYKCSHIFYQKTPKKKINVLKYINMIKINKNKQTKKHTKRKKKKKKRKISLIKKRINYV